MLVSFLKTVKTLVSPKQLKVFNDHDKGLAQMVDTSEIYELQWTAQWWSR